MERLFERFQSTNRALNAFEELADLHNPSAIERDAAIQRFEFSFESCWKLGKQFLYEIEGMDIGSPKGVVRSFRQIGVFSEEEAILGLQLINHRNLTVHTYNRELAEEIYAEVPVYYRFLRQWADRMQDKVNDIVENE